MDEVERLNQKIRELSSKVDTLEKRYNRLIGKVESYTPRTTSLMREGLPLEIFTRMDLISHDFKVLGLYPFSYFSENQATIERSVDIYAMRDSTYTVPEGHGRMSGRSWPERNHLLIEVKQRRAGVEWIFTRKPSSFDNGSVAGNAVPIANSGFEIRHSETGLNSGPNPKDVNNAIAQLNQAYLPFYVDLFAERSLQIAANEWRYASTNEKDNIYLILVTNAKLRYFSPPPKFGDIEIDPDREDSLFPEMPWVVFQPEHPAGLQYHQQQVLAAAHASNEIKPSREVGLNRLDLLGFLSKLTHEIHIINFDHLDKVVELVKNPPRIERIQLSISVDGTPPLEITIDGSKAEGRPL